MAHVVHGLELDRSMGINLYVWSWGAAILLVGLDLWVNVRHLELRSVQSNCIPLPMLQWLLIQTVKLVAASRSAYLLQQSGRSKTTSFHYSFIRVATVYEGR